LLIFFKKNNSNYIWSFLKLFNTKYIYNAFQSIHLGVEIILTWAFSRKHIKKKKKKSEWNEDIIFCICQRMDMLQAMILTHLKIDIKDKV
jgi:hypothetical protein